MKQLIKQILRESVEEKFINTIVNKIKSGAIKAPYFENLKKFGADSREIEIIFKMLFGEDITIEDGNTVINSLGNEIYYEGVTGSWWRKSEYDERGNLIYKKDSYGDWEKYEYDEMGDLIYQENSHGRWMKWEWDDRGNLIYFENSAGYWEKDEYDEMNNLIYREESNRGVLVDKR